MYTPWLKPAPEPDDTFASFTLGQHLQRGDRRCKVGLIGIHPLAARKTRAYLYASAWDFDDLELVDLGDLRKKTIDFTIPLLRELYTSGITPILIGCSDQYLVSQYLAFNDINRQVNLLNVDSRVRLSVASETGQVLDPAVHRKGPAAIHLTHVGSQQHLVDPALWKLFDGNHYESVRLGEAKADVSELEPQIRDADILGFNINALNHQDAPARQRLQPSGFNLQEATQIAYYAGNSDKLSSFGLYGLNPAETDDDKISLTAASYAQLIWYFLQGYSRRVGDFPLNTDGFSEYLVDLGGDARLRFFRSPVTNRWWCEIPAEDFRGGERNRYIACSHQDYVDASTKQDLPDRLLNAFRRYA